MSPNSTTTTCRATFRRMTVHRILPIWSCGCRFDKGLRRAVPMLDDTLQRCDLIELVCDFTERYFGIKFVSVHATNIPQTVQNICRAEDPCQR
jgi:hypothetical protein